MKTLRLTIAFLILFTSCKETIKKTSDLKTFPKNSIRQIEKDGIEKVVKKNDIPIVTIKKIFDDYIENQESTDTQINKDLMTNSIISLDKVTDPHELEILINVWMYYDPTDFSSRDLVFKVLQKNRQGSIKAIKTRIINKKEWETEDIAPFSELNDLLKELGEK
jgi:hypothetical protein